MPALGTTDFILRFAAVTGHIQAGEDHPCIATRLWPRARSARAQALPIFSRIIIDEKNLRQFPP